MSIDECYVLLGMSVDRPKKKKKKKLKRFHFILHFNFFALKIFVLLLWDYGDGKEHYFMPDFALCIASSNRLSVSDSLSSSSEKYSSVISASFT